jgi:hypothetical protein
VNSIGAELFEVSLRRGMFQHRRIHRGRNQHGGRARQVRRRHKIVSDAIGKLCERVRGCRRNDKQINGLRKSYVGDWIRIIGCVVIDYDIRAGQRAKGEGSDELAGVSRHRYADFAPGAL